MPRSLVRSPSLLVLLLAIGAACGGGDKPKLMLGGGCTLNSDCAQPLLCKFSKCHRACADSARDCMPGQRCVQVDGVGVCQQQSACGSGCAAPLICSADMQCRNTCTAAQPCAGAQVCVTIGAGQFCADKTEPVAGGAGDAGASDAGAGDGPPGDAPVGGVPDAGADAPVVPGNDAAPVDTGAPTDAAPEAGPPDLAPACGMASGACCPDMTCGANLACTKAQRCTCVEKCAGHFVARKDGKVIWKGNNVLKGADGQPFVAAGALDIAGGYSSSGPAYSTACVVTKEGTVWCWGPNGNGQLGAALTEAASLTARQVVTSTRAPLTGVKKVATPANSATFCALVDGGGIWCWGEGGGRLLGPGGTTADSSVAVPILAGPGGAPLTGFVDVALSNWWACGVKGDGTVWCWGYYVGANPTQINLLDTASGQVACGTYFCCATTTKDSGVACWNQNAPTTGNRLDYMGGGPVVGITALSKGDYSGAYETVYLVRNDLAVLELWTEPVPLTYKNVAVSAAHTVGEGCFVTAEGQTMPGDWVPFCE